MHATDSAESIDTLAVLYNLGVVPDTWSSESLKLLCPFHQEDTPSLNVNLMTGQWYCFGCDHRGGSVVPLVGGLLGLNAFQSLLKCIELQGGKKTILTQIIRRPPRDYDAERTTAWNFFSSLPQIPWMQTQSSYMHRRGFTSQALRTFDVRANVSSTYPVIVPIYENRRFLGYALRRIDDGQPKYLYNRGLRKNLALFGMYTPGDIVVVTEGVFDVMAALQYGALSAVSLLGWRASDAQVKKLNRAQAVICALDNDECGQLGYERLSTLLDSRIPLVRLPFPRRRKDVRAMTESEFETAQTFAEKELRTLRRQRRYL